MSGLSSPSLFNSLSLAFFAFWTKPVRKEIGHNLTPCLKNAEIIYFKKTDESSIYLFMCTNVVLTNVKIELTPYLLLLQKNQKKQKTVSTFHHIPFHIYYLKKLQHVLPSHLGSIFSWSNTAVSLSYVSIVEYQSRVHGTHFSVVP